MQMKVIEFVEALARIADKVIKISKSDINDSESDEDSKKDNNGSSIGLKIVGISLSSSWSIFYRFLTRVGVN